MNSNGTIGIDDFAVSASVYQSGWDAYLAINNYYNQTNNAGWHTKQGSSPWPYIIYSKQPIKIQSIQFRNRSDDAANVYACSKVEVQASDDNSTYTTITSFNSTNTSHQGIWTGIVNSSKGYKYYKLIFTNSSSYFAMNRFILNATAEYKIKL